MGLTVMLLGNKLEDTQLPSLIFVLYAQNSPNCFSLMPLTLPTSGLPAVPSAFSA